MRVRFEHECGCGGADGCDRCSDCPNYGSNDDKKDSEN